METTLWSLDRLDALGGQRLEVAGAPKVVATERGNAIAFDGRGDGLIVPSDPLAGAPAFTVETLFRPDGGGATEQRFVHLQADGAEDRVLLELRVAGPSWYADTYIRSGTADQALYDPQRVHPLGAWQTLAVSFDGAEMVQYVNGARELSARVTFAPRGPGRVALGMRINRVWWFKGAIRAVRLSDAALPPEKLLRP